MKKPMDWIRSFCKIIFNLGLLANLSACGEIALQFASQRDTGSGSNLKIQSTQVSFDGTYLNGIILVQVSDNLGKPVAGFTPTVSVISNESLAARSLILRMSQLLSPVASSNIEYTLLPCSASDDSGISYCKLRVLSGTGKLNLQITGDANTNPIETEINFYVPPTSISVLPSSVESGGVSTLMTLQGSGFRAPLTVKMGTLNCTDAVVISSTQITCKLTTDSSIGLESIVVTNPDAQTTTLANALLLEDRQAPLVNFNAQPPGISASAVASFTYTLQDNIAEIAALNISCFLDGSPLSCTSSTATASSLADGPHNFRLIATDPSGNQKVENINWTIASIPPTLTIDGSGLGSSPSSLTTPRNISFSGSGVVSYKAKAVRGASCSGVDFSGVASQPIATAFTFNITTDGSYIICAIGQGIAGVWQSTATASTVLEIDTTNPQIVNITGNLTTPSSNASARNLTMNGSSVAAYKAVTLKNISSCSAVDFSSVSETLAGNSYSLTFSGDGSYLVCAIGRNTAHVWQAIATQSSILVLDTTPPVLNAISLGLSPSSSNTNRNFYFSGADVISYKAISYTNGVCDTSTLSASSEKLIYESFSLVPSPDATYQICAIGKDEAGNWQTSPTISSGLAVDTQSPVLTFTAPEVAFPTSSSLTIEGICETGLNVQIAGTGLASSTTTTCAAGTFSQSLTLSSLNSDGSTGDGSRQILVSQTDPAGNTGTASRTFIKDTTPPILTLTDPAAGTTTQGNLNFAGTCEPGLKVTLSGPINVANLDIDCAGNGSFMTSISLTGVDGNKVVSLSSTDKAGNTTTLSRTLVLDTAVPNVSITNPVANFNAKASLTVAGTCENGAGPVNIQETDSNSSSTTPCLANDTFSLSNFILSSGDGIKTITASQTDVAGNFGSFSVTIKKDTVAPLLVLFLPTQNSYAKADVTLSGLCEIGLQVSISGDIQNSPRVLNCGISGNLQATVTPTSTNEIKNILVASTDEAGNSTQINLSLTFDNLAPTGSITAPLAGAVLPGTLAIPVTWSTSDINYGTQPVNIDFSANGGSTWAAVVTNQSASGTYSWNLPPAFANLNTQNARFRAVAVDLAGNASTFTSGNFSIDSALPIVTVLSPSGGEILRGGTTLNLKWTATDANLNSNSIELAYTTDGTTFTNIASGLANSTGSSGYSWTLPTVSSETYRVRVRAQDAANFTGQALSEFFAVDSTPPSLELTSLVGGQTIRGGGANYAITWKVAQDLHLGSGNIKIEYSANSGTSWTTLTSAAPNTGTYNWSVTPTDGTTYRIRLSVSDFVGNGTTVASSSDFAISSVAPELTQTTSQSLIVSIGNTINYGGACTNGLSVDISGSGGNSSVPCSSGVWSWTTPSVSTDGTQNYTFSQTSVSSITTSVSATWIRDTAPPQVTALSINNGSTETASQIANVTVTLSDINISGLKVRILSANASTGDCQSEYSTSTQWLTQTAATNTYPILLSAGDGNKKLCAWAKDAAGNVSVISPSAGTNNVDSASILYAAGNPPRVISLSVSNSVDGTTTYEANAAVSVSWTVEDTEGLDNNPIYLEYTTDNSIWIPILSGYGSLSGNPTSYAYTYRGFNAPSNTYFRLRLTAKDKSGNTSVRALSSPQNTGRWNLFAGSTDRGVGGGAKTLALNFGFLSVFNTFAYDPFTNDLYILDTGTGIIKISATTGLSSYLILHSTTENLSLTGGSLPTSPTLNLSYSGLLFDSNGKLYVKSSLGFNFGAKIIQIDVRQKTSRVYVGANSSGTLGTVAGSSGTPNPSANASTIFMGSGQLAFDASNTLYFFSTCGGTTTSSPTNAISQLWKVTQDPLTQQASQVSLVAGNCTAAAPSSSGVSATGSGLGTNTSINGMGLAVTPTASAIYIRNSSQLYKVIGANIYTTAPTLGATFGQLAISSSGSSLLMTDNSDGRLQLCSVNASGTNGESCSYLTTATSAVADCGGEGKSNTDACVWASSGVAFSPQGQYLFIDNSVMSAGSSGRLRTLDPATNKIYTVAGSLPFYGNGLSRLLARGNISSLYYKTAGENNQSAFGEGLYFTSTDGPVFGRIDSSGNVTTLWGNQIPSSISSLAGTAVTSSVPMGQINGYSNQLPMIFDNAGLPWFIAHNNSRIVSLNSSKQIVLRTAGGGSTSWDSYAPGTNPSSTPVVLTSNAGYMNLSLKGAQVFLLGSSTGAIGGISTYSMIRSWDFTSTPTITHIMGNTSGGPAAEQTTAGSITSLAISDNCKYRGPRCAMQYVSDSVDKIYLADGTLMREIAGTIPSSATLTNKFTFSGGIRNFTLSPDKKRIFFVSDSDGKLYCHSLNSVDVKSWCPQSSWTSLGPSDGINLIKKIPNQFTWKPTSDPLVSSGTLYISNGYGEVLEFAVPSLIPKVTVTSAAQGVVVPTPTVTLSGVCEMGLNVQFTGDLSGSSPTTATCSGGSYSRQIILSSGDGAKNVTVMQTDSAGNAGTAAFSTTVDSTPPVLTLLSPGANTYSSSSLTLTGTCETGGTISVTITDANGSNVSTTANCAAGSYSIMINLPGIDGNKTIRISQTDAAGNLSNLITRNFIKDSTTALDPSTFAWKTLKIGAGGFLTGIETASDGTMIARADVYGAYLWKNNQWTQIVTDSRLPAADVSIYKANFQSAGVQEITYAPSNSQRLYMMYMGYLYRSDNQGGSWVRSPSFAKVVTDPNDPYRLWGQKIAVDPINQNVVYVGTPQAGLWVSYDSGTNFQKVTTVHNGNIAPDSRYPGITGIVFDPTSGQSSGRTNTIYAASYGRGMYVSNDAGASWSSLAGSPSIVSHAKISSEGILYVTGADSGIWRYSAGTWATITPPAAHDPYTRGYRSIAINPANPAQIVAVQQDGILNVSYNRGSSWSGRIAFYEVRSPTVPWHAWTSAIWYFSTSDIVFDKTVANRLWYGEGIGASYATIPTSSYTPYSTYMTSVSPGIEELVANKVLAVPGGKTLVMSWDRPVFRISNPDTYPSRHGPDNNDASPVIHGWSADYASTSPNFVVGLMNYNGWQSVDKTSYSVDGGQTWNFFPSYPNPTYGNPSKVGFTANNKLGGDIAVSTPENILWAPSNDATPYYTLDGGYTWNMISSAAPTSGETGWGKNHVFNRYIAAADRIVPGTFYMYNYLSSYAGVYRSTDGGANWTRVYSGQLTPNSQYHAKLRSVPGKAGHLFFTAGPLDYDGAIHPVTGMDFMRSTDGGATWNVISNVKEVRAFGYGRPAPTSNYPSIFIVGWVNNTYGIYRSDDQGSSWVSLGAYPLGSLDFIKTIDGDGEVYGKCVVGYQGSGYMYFGP